MSEAGQTESFEGGIKRSDNIKAKMRRTWMSQIQSGETNSKEAKLMLFLPREEGQGLVEYALILVLVAIVVIVILSILGPAIGNVFSNVVNAI
jgi:pilus assembly protein Flp/PilA